MWSIWRACACRPSAAPDNENRHRDGLGRYALAALISGRPSTWSPAISPFLERMRERSPLPDGTPAIALGLAINGISTYGFLVLARRAVGDEAYGGLAVVWSLVYILGPGLFQPLEQEVARATAARGSLGQGSAPVLRQAANIGAVFLALVFTGVLVAWPLGLSGMLDDRPDLLAALLLGLAAFAFAELGRGILSGRHLFTEYGRYFAAEGISRMLIAGALVIVGIEMVGAYAITLAAAFLLGTLAAGFTVRPFVNPGPPSHLNELSPALGLLLATSISEAFLLNVGPVALAIIGDELGEEAPGVFLNGLIISRIPLFFFQAVKASLLPALAARAADDDLDGFREVQLRLVGAVAVVAAGSTAAIALVGPWVVETAFSDSLGSRDMGFLAASGGGLMLMLSLSLGLVALNHTRLAIVGFLVAVAVFPIALQFPNEPFLQVEVGLLAATSAGAIAQGVLLRIEFARHRAAGRMSSLA
jgi:O-antigen/teichoic acid export membrane protein